MTLRRSILLGIERSKILQQEAFCTQNYEADELDLSDREFLDTSEVSLCLIRTEPSSLGRAWGIV